MISISDYKIEMLVYILVITYFMWICGMSSYRFMLELTFDKKLELALTKNMGNSKILIVLAALLVLFASAKLYSNYDTSTVNREAKTPRNDLKVLLYTKDTCKYCILAKELLDKNAIPYEAIELANNRDLHQKMADQTGQNTVPYVYINGEFIGGYKSLQELEKSGKLYIESEFKEK